MLPQVYLDTNPLIYAVEGEPEVALPIQTLLLALKQQPGKAITSELTLAEVMVPKQGFRQQSLLKRQYLDLLVWSGFIDLQPVSRDILYETIDLRAASRTTLKLPDAIHLATALRAGCRFFISNDKDIQTPDGMQRVESDENSMVRVIEALE